MSSSFRFLIRRFSKGQPSWSYEPDPTFIPPSHRGSTFNLVTVRPAILEEKKFKTLEVLFILCSLFIYLFFPSPFDYFFIVPSIFIYCQRLLTTSCCMLPQEIDLFISTSPSFLHASSHCIS